MDTHDGYFVTDLFRVKLHAEILNTVSELASISSDRDLLDSKDLNGALLRLHQLGQSTVANQRVAVLEAIASLAEASRNIGGGGRIWNELHEQLPWVASIASYDAEIGVRLAAIDALGAFGPEASSELCPILLDLISPKSDIAPVPATAPPTPPPAAPTPPVIQRALAALVGCGEQALLRALPDLIRLAQDANQGDAIRRLACEALGRIGAAASSGIPVLAEIVLDQELRTNRQLSALGRAAAHALAQVDPYGSFLQNQLTLDALDQLSEQLLTCGEPEALLARRFIEWSAQVQQAPRQGEQWMQLIEIIEYVFGPSPQGKSEYKRWYDNNAHNINNAIDDRRLKAILIRRGIFAVESASLEMFRTIHRQSTDERKSPPDPPPSNGTGTEADRK